MLHDYDNPNTCYAIGDSFSQHMGTGTTSRQPASGVFEELSAFVKQDGSDLVEMYNGSTGIRLIDYNSISGANKGDTANVPAWNLMNTSHKFGNTVYIRKTGTSAIINVSGVQVDS